MSKGLDTAPYCISRYKVMAKCHFSSGSPCMLFYKHCVIKTIICPNDFWFRQKIKKQWDLESC